MLPPDPPKTVDAPKPARKLLKVAPIAAAPNAVSAGSYLQSCGPASVTGDLRTATCQRRMEAGNTSSISVSRCSGVDIANSDGGLRCIARARTHWGGRVVPGGRWCTAVPVASTARC